MMMTKLNDLIAEVVMDDNEKNNDKNNDNLAAILQRYIS